MLKINKLLIAALCTFFIAAPACTPEIEIEDFTNGSADFSRYLAVGNSITAGFAGNGLTRSGQLNSYPNLLHQQFGVVQSVEDFNQPLLPEGNGSGPMELVSLGLSSCGSPAPVTQSTTPDPNWSNSVYGDGPFNNLAVPGLSVYDATNASLGTNLLNPNIYFTRFLEDADNVSYIDLVTETADAIDPTFFTSFLGNNDILGYAATGGGYANINGIPDVSIPPITPIIPTEEVFRNNYNALMDAIAANGDVQGVLLTLPNVTSLPFFTTVASTVTSPEDCTTQLTLYTKATAADGTNSLVNEVTENDVVLLRASSTIGRLDTLVIDGETQVLPHGLHPNNPLDNGEVLDAGEKAEVLAAHAAFNNIIREIANERNLAVADIDAYLNKFNQDSNVDGVSTTAAFLVGGTFALDGVHLTERGYALIANEVLRTINDYYDANVPGLDVNSFTGIIFP